MLSLISYVHCTKAELWAIVKDFPEVTEDPQRFAEEFNIVIQTYQLGFSDLHQLIHILISKGQAHTEWKLPIEMILRNL